MGDPGKKKKKQEEIDVHEEFGSETKKPTFKIDTFVKFVDFMKDPICDKTTYKQEKEFKDNINEAFAWFHKNYLGKDIKDKLPPKLAGLEVCLFELVKLVEGMGGYYEVSQKQEWDEVAMGFGYPENYDINFKFMYEDYLLQAAHFFELARNNIVGTMAAPEGFGEKVGETNSNGNHPDWYIDHIKAIEDNGKVGYSRGQ